MELKALQSFVKSIEGRKVTGIASVFGNIDSYGDIVHKGAFKKTIEENGARVKHLWMHDPWQPPTAKIIELSEISRTELPDVVKEKFPQAKGGLQVVREYLDTPRGNEILAGIQAGAINEMSIGYDSLKWDIEEIKEGEAKGMIVRNLRELRLWDVSDVTFGANEATVASKAAIDTELQFAVKRIESLLTNTKAGRVLSASNLEKLKNALAVLNDILLSAEPSEDEESLKSLTEQIFKKLAQTEINFQILTREVNYGF